MTSTPAASSATRELAAFISGFRFADLPSEVVHEGRRGILDWIGCALAGSRHPTLDKLVAVLSETSGRERAPVFGRDIRLGLLEASLVNGQAGHVLDYDDTHMGGTVLHTSSPVLAALFALAEHRRASGRDLLSAYIAGFEAGVRTGQAAPRHHDGGWHLTGTLGTIAAGAAAAKLLVLDEQKTTHALGIAATQSAGMQQNRGTMCKSFHAGKAASNGLLAALLAEKGFDSATDILDGKKGFCRIYSIATEAERLVDGLGKRWTIAENGYKPYACGIVLHPAIDAMIEIAERARLPAQQISCVELRVHPHVISITGVVEPRTGLQSKFSIYHSAAVAYLYRAAGIRQYSDATAADPTVISLRQKVRVTTDQSLRTDEAYAQVQANGVTFDAKVEHATGTTANPMSDAALERKFRANAEPVVGADNANEIAELVWKIDELAGIAELTSLLRAR